MSPGHHLGPEMHLTTGVDSAVPLVVRLHPTASQALREDSRSARQALHLESGRRVCREYSQRTIPSGQTSRLLRCMISYIVSTMPTPLCQSHSLGVQVKYVTPVQTPVYRAGRPGIQPVRTSVHGRDFPVSYPRKTLLRIDFRLSELYILKVDRVRSTAKTGFDRQSKSGFMTPNGSLEPSFPPSRE